MAWENPVSAPPDFATTASWDTWWKDAYQQILKSREAYRNQWTTDIAGRKASLTAYQNAWTPMDWESSPWYGNYQNQQTGMEGLLTKIQGFGGSADMADANAMVAQSYGMTPEQYQELQAKYAGRLLDPTAAAQSDASAANAYLESIANSAFSQEQDKATRLAMREAEADIGKQLESIFGERGGLGGFQAAYDLTLGLENAFLQQKTQEHLSMFNQAVTAVNANNQYYSDLINQGAISAKDYLAFRFDQLQTGYQDYMTAMDQTWQQFITAETLDERQFQQISQNLQSQINNMTDQLNLEMGGMTDQEYLAMLESLWSGQIANKIATEGEEPSLGTLTSSDGSSLTINNTTLTNAQTQLDALYASGGIGWGKYVIASLGIAAGKIASWITELLGL